MGAGSWGTAFSQVLADAGHDITLWGRTDAVVAGINEVHRNDRYLPGIVLPSGIVADADPQRTLTGADLVVLAVPSQTLRENLHAWGAAIPRRTPVLSLLKGLELQTGERMSEVVTEAAQVDPRLVAVLSGPNLSREIAERQPAATVVACVDEDVARVAQQACSTPYFRPYTNTDVVGVELGGVVKNVIAMATGIADGMGFGDNSKASIITRGLAEMTRLGVAMGADPLTFAGLAGIGDLVATCMSPLSRNRTFGENLGRGMTVAEVVAITSQTAEGVASCRAVLSLAQEHGVSAPITEHVVAVVHQGMSPHDMARSIMSRATRPEW